MDLRTLLAKSYPHERLFAGYLVFLAALMLVAGRPLVEWAPRIVAHLAAATGIMILLPSLGERGARSHLRHWLPVAFLPIVYLELDTLNNLFGSGFHDAEIVALEQAIFQSQPAKMLRSWVPVRPLSEYLHLAYFSYYFLFPALAIALYTSGRRNEYRYAATVTLAVFAVCYTIFICYPVSGPWNYFERPGPDEVGRFVPSLVHFVLVTGESVGTAFPSSHVAVALAVWMLAARLDRRMFIGLSFFVPGLIIGTIYGGFHYAIDVVLGMALGAALVLAGPIYFRALGGTPPERSRLSTAPGTALDSSP